MSEYLTASELADLIGCKPNQKSIMRRWLDQKRWRYIEDKTGLPRVMRDYRDKKLGVINGKENKLDSAPNLSAFMGVH